MARQRLSLNWLLGTVCAGTLFCVFAAFWLQYSLLRDAEREIRRVYSVYGILSGFAVNIKSNLVQADSQLERYIEAPARSNRDAGYTQLAHARAELDEYAALQNLLPGKNSKDLTALRAELEENIPALLQLVLQTHEASERVHEARQKLFDFMLLFEVPSGLLLASGTPERRIILAEIETGLNHIRNAVVQSVANRSPEPLRPMDALITRLSELGVTLTAFADADSEDAKTAEHYMRTGAGFTSDMLRMRGLIMRLFGEWDRLSLVKAEAATLGQRNIIAASRIVENTLLVGNASRIELEASLEHIANMLSLLAAVAGLVCLGGAWVLYSRLSKPVALMTHYVRTAVDRQLPEPLPVQAVPELDALASLIEHLSSHLYTRLTTAEQDKNAAIEACIAARNELAARNAFLSYVGHEIRTPAISILGLLYLCRKSELPPALEGYLAKVQLAAETQLSVLNNMLDFTRMEADNLALQRAPFSLSRVLDDLRGLVLPSITAKSLSFDLTIARDVPDKLLGDAMRLRQILHNLTSNAVKFTERGGISISVAPGAASKVDAELGPLDVCLHFCVQDTGIGIPADMVYRLFEPFQQGGDSSSYASNGLGLSIAYRLAHLMRGRLWVRSQDQVGSEFHFTIVCAHAATDEPVRQASLPLPASPAAHSSPVSYMPPRLQGFHVLLVEDDSISSQIATELLESCDLRVTAVQTGIEAVHAAEHGTFDLILMDIQMPVIDGLETTRRIRKLSTKQPPIIAMTAHTLDEDRQRCFESGMQGYIAKPIEVEALHALLKQYLHPPARNLAPTAPAPVTEIPMTALDVTLGLHHLNGNEKLYDKLLRRFADSNAAVTQEIRTAADAGDMETAIRTAHTLKGVAASLGATRLHEQALEIEQALKGGQPSPEALDRLQAALEQALAAINARLG